MNARTVLGLLLAIAVFPALAPAIAHAEELRCGVRLISVGDSEAVVRESCGEPTSTVRKSLHWRHTRALRDEWVYDFGPTDLVRVLTFDPVTDRLVGIIIGDRGR